MLNFDFLEKGLGRVSLPHCVYDFTIQMFLMLYSITRIFFYKKPVYKKPRNRYPQATPNLGNFKNYKKNGILT